MAARLTDEQKKKIIADYVESGSYNATAKRFGIADTTVKRVVESDAETQRKAEQKKEQNTADMLAYMESRKEKAQEAVDAYLDALTDPEKIKAAKLSEIATAMGIVVDKFTKTTAAGEDTLAKLDDVLKKIGGAGNET